MQGIGVAELHFAIWKINGSENAPSRRYSMVSKPVETHPSCLDIHQLVQTESVASDRRNRERVHVHWPLSFFRAGTTEILETVTQNLSSDGFYCVTSSVLVPGEIRACTLNVPTHHPNGGPKMRRVLCRVRIVRVEKLENSVYGVGCHIEDYRFIEPWQEPEPEGADWAAIDWHRG
jgi:hypothetical protein